MTNTDTFTATQLDELRRLAAAHYRYFYGTEAAEGGDALLTAWFFASRAFRRYMADEAFLRRAAHCA